MILKSGTGHTRDARTNHWPAPLCYAEPERVTNDNAVEVLIDSEVTLARAIDLINSAQSSIYLMQSEFRPYFVAVYQPGPAPVSDAQKPRDILTDVIHRKVGADDVRACILLNQNLVIPDDVGEIQAVFEGTSVHVRGFPTVGPHVMHAKALIVDETEALVIGSPFRQDFWDGSEHLIHDRRRGAGDIAPKHDVSIYLRGGAVAHVAEYFAQLWNYLSDKQFGGRDKIALAVPQAPAGTQSVQIARSITPKTLTPEGEMDILNAYERAIGNAHDFIYLENQYFTNKAIIRMLRHALKRNPTLQIIILLNENPDIPPYLLKQRDTLKRLGRSVERPLMEHPRVGVFTLWSRGFEEGRLTLQHCYVHSKVGIVDDVWATIGSANLDGPSLDGADEFKPFANPRKHRSMELNAVLCDSDDVKSSEIVQLRRSLWAEHLETKDALLSRPAGGWLSLWRKLATDNVSSLNESHPTMNGRVLPYAGRVLPYAAKAGSKAGLMALGVAIERINVIEDPLLPPQRRKQSVMALKKKESR
ncbi:MAG: phospholipase D-like domain-containing protein [Halobacteriota archaeon]